jgi:hypothetical protein
VFGKEVGEMRRIVLGIAVGGLLSVAHAGGSEFSPTNVFETVGEPIAGEDGMMSVTLPKGSSPAAFYRIKVEQN